MLLEKNINEIVENFTTIKELEKHLNQSQSRINFGSSKTVPTINQDSILINPIDWLKGNSDFVDYEFEFMNDVNELVESLEYNEFEYDKGDNSYNYSGYLAREINLHTFKSKLTDSVLVAYQVHTGLDVRAGYTKSVWVKYESGYDFINHLSLYFSTVSVKVDDDYFSIDISGFYDMATVYYDTDKGYIDTEYYLDFYSIEDLKNNIIKILTENEIEFEDIKITKYCY